MTAPELLLLAESAVNAGADLLRQGPAHVSALISKGDRDYASDVDVAIERAVKRELAAAAPGLHPRLCAPARRRAARAGGPGR